MCVDVDFPLQKHADVQVGFHIASLMDWGSVMKQESMAWGGTVGRPWAQAGVWLPCSMGRKPLKDIEQGWDVVQSPTLPEDRHGSIFTSWASFQHWNDTTAETEPSLCQALQGTAEDGCQLHREGPIGQWTGSCLHQPSRTRILPLSTQVPCMRILPLLEPSGKDKAWTLRHRHLAKPCYIPGPQSCEAVSVWSH